jgi:hemerythrin-like domain-containing protein
VQDFSAKSRICIATDKLEYFPFTGMEWLLLVEHSQLGKRCSLMGKATQNLREEHDTILHALTILDKMLSTDGTKTINRLQNYKEMVYFLKLFADKCHHGKEENYLFVELVKHGVHNEGGPVGVMLREHELGRQYIAAMHKSLETQDFTGYYNAAARYGDLLRVHIQKENKVLFVMADKLLNEEKQAQLFKNFEQFEESIIGHGVHDKLQVLLHKWSEEFK